MEDEKVRRRVSASIRGTMVAQTVIAAAAALWGIAGPDVPFKILPWLIFLVLAAAALLIFLRAAQTFDSREVSGETQPLPKMPERTVENLGYFDDLTGLPARPWFDYTLRTEIARAKRYRHPLSQIILDIDDFSTLNEKRGRASGDYVLMTLSDIMRTSVRVSDQVARVADDEFAIVIAETDSTGANIVGEKIRRAVELYPFDEGLEITVSVGIVTATESDSPETFLIRGETAVATARERGGNVCATEKS